VNQIFFIIVLAVLFTACSSSGKKDTAKTQSELQVKSVNEVALTSYKRHCLACHQRDAGGVPGMYPPLAGNKVVSGDKNALIDIMLNGMSGEIEVDGEKYNGIMASYKNLSDQEIANILNYIRSNFGNSGEVIKPSEIKARR